MSSIYESDCDEIFQTKKHSSVWPCAFSEYDRAIKNLIKELRSVFSQVHNLTILYSEGRLYDLVSDFDEKLSDFENCKLMQFFSDDWPTEKLNIQNITELVMKSNWQIDLHSCIQCRCNSSVLASVPRMTAMHFDLKLDQILNQRPQLCSKDAEKYIRSRIQKLDDRALYIQSRINDLYLNGFFISDSKTKKSQLSPEPIDSFQSKLLSKIAKLTKENKKIQLELDKSRVEIRNLKYAIEKRQLDYLIHD